MAVIKSVSKARKGRHLGRTLKARKGRHLGRSLKKSFNYKRVKAVISPQVVLRIISVGIILASAVAPLTPLVVASSGLALFVIQEIMYRVAPAVDDKIINIFVNNLTEFNRLVSSTSAMPVERSTSEEPGTNLKLIDGTTKAGRLVRNIFVGA